MTLRLDITDKISRYQIKGELGRGSMGRVYLAEDPNIGRQVALKIFSPKDVDPEAEEDLAQRFVTEAKAAGQLNHPGIVTVYDAGTDRERELSFIAMEWVDGESLHDLLARQGRLPTSMAIALVSQVALALDYAHGQGIVHRDVKPANILVDRSGRARIMDFGVAKLGHESRTLAGMILGTPTFMSPEQIRAGEIDGRSDLFSLATVLHLCLTGSNPFSSDSIASVTYKVVHEEIPPIRTLAPEISEELEAVVERALAKSPEERFQTGAELAGALERAAPIAQTLVEKAPPAAPEKTVREEAEDLASLDDLDDLRDLPPIDATILAQPEKTPPAPSRVRPVWALAALAGFVLVALLAAALQIFQNTPDPPGIPADGEETAVAPEPPPAEPDAVVPGKPPPPVQGEETPPPSPAPSAAIELVYTNHLKRCDISVDVDGVRVWSRTMAPKNAVHRLTTGQKLRVAIPVPPGPRTIRVRIRGTPQIAVSQTIESALGAGETRRLRATLKRSSRELTLAWIE